MKKIWGITLCVVLATLLYAGILTLLKTNPLEDLKGFFKGKNTNFISILSPFIYITVLYYSIIFYNYFFVQTKKSVNKFNKVVKNIDRNGNSQKRKTKSVLGKSEYMEAHYDNEQIDYSTEKTETPFAKDNSLDKSNKYKNEFDQKTNELESQLNNNYNNNAKLDETIPEPQSNIEQITHKNNPIVITLLKDESDYEHNPLFLKDVNANDGIKNYEHSINKEETLEKLREKLEHEEKHSLETITIENTDNVSDVEALAVAEGLEDGNTLFSQNNLFEKKRTVFNVLDNLNKMGGLDEILSSKD